MYKFVFTQLVDDIATWRGSHARCFGKFITTLFAGFLLRITPSSHTQHSNITEVKVNSHLTLISCQKWLIRHFSLLVKKWTGIAVVQNSAAVGHWDGIDSQYCYNLQHYKSITQIKRLQVHSTLCKGSAMVLQIIFTASALCTLWIIACRWHNYFIPYDQG